MLKHWKYSASQIGLVYSRLVLPLTNPSPQMFLNCVRWIKNRKIISGRRNIWNRLHGRHSQGNMGKMWAKLKNVGGTGNAVFLEGGTTNNTLYYSLHTNPQRRCIPLDTSTVWGRPNLLVNISIYFVLPREDVGIWTEEEIEPRRKSLGSFTEHNSEKGLHWTCQIFFHFIHMINAHITLFKSYFAIT